MLKTEICKKDVCIRTESTGKSEAPMRVYISFLMLLFVGLIVLSATSISEGAIKRLV
jgi:hypothetical protein